MKIKAYTVPVFILITFVYGCNNDQDANKISVYKTLDYSEIKTSVSKNVSHPFECVHYSINPYGNQNTGRRSFKNGCNVDLNVNLCERQAGIRFLNDLEKMTNKDTQKYEIDCEAKLAKAGKHFHSFWLASKNSSIFSKTISVSEGYMQACVSPARPIAYNKDPYYYTCQKTGATKN